jgi:hypothetical protein
LGKDVLYAIPEVSVARLDGVKLEDLVKLETGSVETNRVTRILARRRRLDVQQHNASSLKHAQEAGLV